MQNDSLNSLIDTLLEETSEFSASPVGSRKPKTNSSNPAPEAPASSPRRIENVRSWHSVAGSPTTNYKIARTPPPANKESNKPSSSEHGDETKTLSELTNEDLDALLEEMNEPTESKKAVEKPSVPPVPKLPTPVSTKKEKCERVVIGGSSLKFGRTTSAVDRR
jgi:hypothetical protein